MSLSQHDKKSPTPLLSRIRRSRWRIVIQGFALAGMILQPVSVSLGDWVTGGTNGNADYSWDDTDANGAWDNGEEGFFINSDGDLLPDHAERSLGTDIFNPDSDYDGLNDYDEAVALVPSGFSFSPLSADTDANGFTDHDEFYGCFTVNYTSNPPSLAGWTYSDWDGDGVKNHADAYPFDPNNGAFLDSDGDGCYDSFDTDPSNPALWDDHNRNGINDSAEPPVTDADGDGHDDGGDSHPSDAGLWSDWNGNGTNDDQHSDGDGVPDELDSHPTNAILWSDWNANGINDDQDSDADTVPDESDSHPSNASLWSDWNANGINDDAHSDADGVPDELDSHPSNASLWCDWNNNGTNDTSEVDGDGDNVWDSLDSHPTNSALWCDWNGTGINDDQNTDGDNAADDFDSDPSNSALWSDWNHNGANDDQNSDSDSVIDDYDSDPLNSTLWADWNRNGTNDFDEPPPPADSDLDGVQDASDSDPYNWWLWEDWNHNGTNDSQEWTPPGDSDDDGIPDDIDEYPNDPFNGDSDQDGALDAIEAQHGAVVGMLDTDEDGLTDGQEINTTHTDPAVVDTDGDGLTDSEETMIVALVQLGVSPLNANSLSALFNDWEMAQPRLLDTDHDGIPNYIETLYGLNPSNAFDAAADLDADGISNLDQYNAGRSLLAGMEVFDHDDDGMSDAWETANQLNPNWFDDAVGDADMDGILNVEEYVPGTYEPFPFPLMYPFYMFQSADDYDGDQIPNLWEYRYHLNLRNCWDAAWDMDGDGLANIDEFRIHTDPTLQDSRGDGVLDGARDFDGDGLSNAFEISHGGYWGYGVPTFDATVGGEENLDYDGDGLSNLYEYLCGLTPWSTDSNNNGLADSDEDPDLDGLTNLQEQVHGTKPKVADTDGDAYKDGFEMAQGTNPLLATSSPLTVVQQQITAVQALLAQYQALPVTLDTLSQRDSLWAQIQGILDDVDDALDDLAPETSDPGSLAPAQSAADGARDGAAEQPASMAETQVRWVTSYFTDETRRYHESEWTWEGSGWTRSGGYDSEPISIGGAGGWDNSSPNSGSNWTLADAQLRCTLPGNWANLGIDGWSAHGAYTQVTGGSNQPPVPGWPDPEPEVGYITITTAIESSINNWFGAVREFRLKRSAEGRQDVDLAVMYVKTVSGSDVITTGSGVTTGVLTIPAGSSISTGSVEIAAVPQYSNTSHSESVGLLDIEVVNKDKVAVTELKVADMEESLKDLERLQIDEDPARFYVRIPGLSGVQSVSVKLGTVENLDASYNDNATEIELTNTNGTFETKSLLLVGGDVDDDYSGDYDIPVDDQKNDRTHKVQLGGKVKVSAIIIDGHESTMDLRVPVPVKKTVTINAVVMTDGGSPNVADEVRMANELYASTGVKIMLGSTVSQPPPPPLPNMPDNGSRVMNSDIADWGRYISHYGTTPNINDIHVFFVKQCVNSSEVGIQGFSITENTIGSTNGTTTAGQTGDANNVFISELHAAFKTLGHELGHVLTNAGHYGEFGSTDYESGTSIRKQKHNLMRLNPAHHRTDTDQIGEAKRLYEVQREMLWNHNTLVK